MSSFRHTSKTLDMLLNRDQRWVYLLCRQEISKVELADKTLLAKDVLEATLLDLLGFGLIEQLTPSAPASSPPVPSPSLDRLAETKTRLLIALQASVGSRAANYTAEIQSKQSMADLEEMALRLIVKLRLTVSQQAASSLEATIRNIFS